MARNHGDIPFVKEVTPYRINGKTQPPRKKVDRVAVESTLTIEIADVGEFTLMCTPCDDLALAVGFAFTERIITKSDDIALLCRCPDDPGVIRMRLKDPGRVVSACGMCGGKKVVEEMLSGLVAVDHTLTVAPAQLPSIMAALLEKQEIFRLTGGTHAAAIFDRQGRFLAFAEDLGRHNALDKVIGKCVLDNRPMAGCGVALSGRVSFELVSKCVCAGIEFIAAVSAPSSLALDAAEKCNLTICSFVREDRATVYTHPSRIINLEG